ncbi:hypothetical protein [Oceanibacterium hippocampi]|uniref:Uncharacterized protein n=1 Tax=Oceanibacterium hippocampi TaxID=745714 RepID=A0A1Y5S7N8_9PROT|nr:hypothetical protein [Oceanibacterium hippocampi]SLN31697.1 hypothetical protein OCH7691_01139 [Oceanibacterium hippocampi]
MTRLLLLLACLALTPLPALAEGFCLPPGDMDRAIRESRWRETPLFAGIGGQGRVVALYGNVRTGSWTLVMEGPDGTFCGLAAGNRLRLAPAAPGGAPQDGPS